MGGRDFLKLYLVATGIKVKVDCTWCCKWEIVNLCADVISCYQVTSTTDSAKSACYIIFYTVVHNLFVILDGIRAD